MPGSGQRLAGIPEGIGSFGEDDFMHSHMNHEISGAARVSKFSIDTANGTIVNHHYTIDGTEGYSRLCSASWQDAVHVRGAEVEGRAQWARPTLRLRLR